MKYRIFGSTDWLVSEIGFGAWAIGGGWGPVNDKQSVQTLIEAWEQGINLVDTAQMYGKGHSETVIGEALKQWKGHHVYIATKVQPQEWPHPSEDDPDITSRYPKAYIREQCEASLQRLGVESIDLYQLHGWFPKGIVDTEWYEALIELKKEGKIREIGISLRDYRPDEGIEIAKTGRIQSEQVVYNLFEQRPVNELFPTCKEHKVAILARVPFDESALVGNWAEDTYASFPVDDLRHVYFKGERFKKTYEKVEEMKRLVQEMTGGQYSSLAEVALRFCLSQPAVTCVIPGMVTRQHLLENCKVSDGIPLSEELLTAMRVFNWPRNYHNPDAPVDPL